MVFSSQRVQWVKVLGLVGYEEYHAKDAVKLPSMRFELPCYVLEIEIRIEDEERLLGLIDKTIQG